MRFAKRQFDTLGKPAISAVLVLLIFLQVAMAASETLHKFFHADADQPGHECAVTLFAHGQVDTSSVDVPLPVTVSEIELPHRAPVSFFVSLPHDLPPGRGPPLSA